MGGRRGKGDLPKLVSDSSGMGRGDNVATRLIPSIEAMGKKLRV